MMAISVYPLGVAYPITSHLKLGEMLWVGVVLQCRRAQRLFRLCNLVGQAFADQMQTVKPLSLAVSDKSINLFRFSPGKGVCWEKSPISLISC